MIMAIRWKGMLVGKDPLKINKMLSAPLTSLFDLQGWAYL